MPRPTVLLCMGTHSEIIKMAPVYRALADGPLRPVVVHTGQEDGIEWPLYRFLGMAPDHTLALPRERPALRNLSGKQLDAVGRLLDGEGASAVLVHGGTTAALSAAMAAFYAGSPVGHVEAGLPSADPIGPSPEAANRTLIARLARWHYAPTHRAVGTLLRGGVPADGIDLVGSTTVDAARHGVGALGGGAPVPESLPDGTDAWARGGRLALVSMHGDEDGDRPIEAVAEAVGRAAAETPDLHVLWPVPPSVRAAAVAGMARAGLGAAADRVRLTGPLAYPALLWALRRSWVVLTDSGGVQEEAAALDRPVLVLRRTADRPELIEAGGGVLVGTDGADVARWLRALASDAEVYGALRCEAPPYGDGSAGDRIAASLAAALAPTAAPRPAPALPQSLLPTMMLAPSTAYAA